MTYSETYKRNNRIHNMLVCNVFAWILTASAIMMAGFLGYADFFLEDWNNLTTAAHFLYGGFPKGFLASAALLFVWEIFSS